MHKDPRFSRLFLNLDRGSATPPSLWQKIVGGVAALGVFALALTFSVALFAVVITVGVVVWGYLWWKTRAVRKAMREHMAAEMEARRAAGAAHSGGAAATRGLIIEGEVIREVKIDEPPAADRRDRA
jgi:O-antigen ligase